MIKTVPNSFCSTILLFTGLVVFQLLSSTIGILETFNDRGSYASGDFIEYWSAFRIAIDSSPEANPYNGEQILAVQQSLRAQSEPLMMWNPPWLLVLFSPILCLPWKLSVLAWFGVSLLSYAFASYLVLSSVSKTPLGSRNPLFDKWKYILVFLSFPPLWTSLELGQIGCFLYLGVALLWRGLEKENPFAGAVGLVLLSLKPHLFLTLILVLLLFWARRLILPVLLYGLLLQGLFVLLVLVFDSSLVSNWLSGVTKGDPSGLATKTSSWIGVTPFSALRLLAWSPESRVIFYKLSWLAPCFGLIYIFKNLFYESRLETLVSKLRDYFPTLVLVSVLASPFGWYFDLVALALILPYCLWSKSSAFVLWLIFIGGTVFYKEFAVHHHDMFWFLPLLSILYFISPNARNQLKSSWSN